MKLRSKLKELNELLERTLEKANAKKMAAKNNGQQYGRVKYDTNHQIKVKE